MMIISFKVTGFLCVTLIGRRLIRAASVRVILR